MPLKSACLCLLCTHPSGVVKHMGKLCVSSVCLPTHPRRLLLYRLNSPALSGFPPMKCSSLLITLAALRSALSVISVALSYWGAQNWTQHSRCGITSAGQRGRISTLDLLAAVHLARSRMPFASVVARAHCWLRFHLLSVHQGLFLQSCFPTAFLQPSVC